ncbi:MAG: hypothetical protein IJ371_01710 [Clostridia bacterium]|nr:hypothetical protein [Clostridia bacterium]
MKKEKQKLVGYLYPTKQIKSLMCNDIYQELLELISIEHCISKDNINPNVRNNNLEFVQGAIKGFVLGNKDYSTILFEYYKHNNLDWIARDILIGLVLYISTISEEFEDIDIIKDEQSILYGESFILELI